MNKIHGRNKNLIKIQRRFKMYFRRHSDFHRLIADCKLFAIGGFGY